MPQDFTIKVKLVGDDTPLKRSISGGGGGGGVGGDIIGKNIKQLGGALLGAASIFGAVKILESIHESIKKQTEEIKKVSPSFNAIRETMEKSYQLALKPMGDIMAVFLKPFLALQMLRLRSGLTEAAAITRQVRAGTLSPEEGIAKVGEIFKAMAEGIAFIQNQANKQLEPILGAIAGFKSGLDLVYNNFLGGIAGFLGSMLEGITRNMGVMPESLAKWITEETAKNASFLNQVPESIVDPYIAWLTTGAGQKALSEVPIEAAKAIQNEIISGIDTANIPGAIGNFGIILKDKIAQLEINLARRIEEAGGNEPISIVSSRAATSGVTAGALLREQYPGMFANR